MLRRCMICARLALVRAMPRYAASVISRAINKFNDSNIINESNNNK